MSMISAQCDELRRLLDERGVEWRGGLPTETMVEADGLDLLYVALPDGRVRAFIRNYLTPEQAVAATLGDADATGERQRDTVEIVRCKDCERFAVDQSDHDYRSGWWCHRWNTDMVKPDGYCAWACRKEQQ